MKKYFSVASVLMLALGMGMTSCSDDLDEVQAPAEQQPDQHMLHLSATAPNSPATRAYVEGVEGKDDAIKITGWKEGDKLYGIYLINSQSTFGYYDVGDPASVAFTFNGTEFVSEPTTVTPKQILYFIHGDGTLGGPMEIQDWGGGYYIPNFYFIPTNFASKVDVEGHDTDIMMFGTASIKADKLTTDMQLPANMSFVCLHNDSESPITVRLISDTEYISKFFMHVGPSVAKNGSANVDVKRTSDRNEALKAIIPAHGKAYLPVQASSGITKVEVTGTIIAAKVGIEAGKIYKLIYEPTGTGKATGNETLGDGGDIFGARGAYFDLDEEY